MSQNEEAGSGSVQNTRGVSTGKNLRSKAVDSLQIKFNGFGQPTGPNRPRFASDMGNLARNIKITYRDWTKVPLGLKETLWKDVKRTWKVEDDKKDIVLKMLSRAFKEFRSRLTRTYITKTMKTRKGVVVDNPCGKYRQIAKEDWEEFKKGRMEKSFQDKSAKARVAQSKNLHRHFLGRAGYVGKEDIWLKEEIAKELAREATNDDDPNTTLTQETIESITSRLSDRGERWVKAHTPSKGSPAPHTQQVINNFVEWRTKEQKGDYVSSRLEDPLVKAIGKAEHPGRTRGVGSNVGLQSYFGKPSASRKGKIYTEEDLRLLIDNVKRETKEEVEKETMEKVNAMIEKKWAEMMEKMSPVTRNGNVDSSKEPSPRVQVQSSCHSTHPADPFVSLKEPTRCRLAVLLNKELIVVADALVHPWKDGSTVHHKPLTVENAKVSIDNAIEPNVALPVPWDEFTTVGHAVGSFAQWPKSLVVLDENGGNMVAQKKRSTKTKDTKETTKKLRKKVNSVETSNQEQTTQKDEELDRKPLNGEEVMTLGPYCRSLEQKLCSMSKDDTVKIVIDKSVYNYSEQTQSIDILLTVVEIRQMFRNKWLNIVTLQTWGSFLHQYATQLKVIDEVAYMCPVKLTEYMRNPPQCEDYIAHILKTEEKKKFIMGPFFESNHWMLIVACLGLSTIYILDSQQATPKKFDIKARLNGAWSLHCIRGGRRHFGKSNKLEIKDNVKCAQQPRSYECGYYVMKWMYNITFYYSTAKEEDFEKFIASCTISTDNLNEMKEMWANKCVENM